MRLSLTHALAYGVVSLLVCGSLCACSPVDDRTDAEILASTAAADAGIDRSDVAAVVGGVVITQHDVDERVAHMRETMGLADDASFKSYLERTGSSAWDVRARSIKTMIDETLVREEAARLSIEIDDDEVRTLIDSLSSRYPSHEAWVDALAYNGYTESRYEDAIRMSMLTYKVRDAVIVEVEPTQEQISQYAVVVAPTLTGRRSSQILLPSGSYAAAVEVHRLLDEGADFTTLVHEYSTDGSAQFDGDMGWDCINTYNTPYQEALNKLDAGEVSPIVRSGFGYHIIMCTDRYDAPVNPDGSIDLDAIPDDLLEYIKRSMRSTLKEQEFNAYMGNLEATTALAVFDEHGEQVEPDQIGLSTEVVDLGAAGLSEGSAADMSEEQAISSDIIDPTFAANPDSVFPSAAGANP